MKLLSRPLAVPRWAGDSQAATMSVAAGSSPAWKTPMSIRPPMSVKGLEASAHSPRATDQPTVQQVSVARGPARWASQPAGAWSRA